MTDLDRLIEDVEAGNTPSAVRFAAAWPDAGHGGLNAYRAANGSLDAAVALKDALLPGWTWECGTLSQAASVYPPSYPGENFDDECFSAEDATPARALLLAVLRAYRAAQREA